MAAPNKRVYVQFVPRQRCMGPPVTRLLARRMPLKAALLTVFPSTDFAAQLLSPASVETGNGASGSCGASGSDEQTASASTGADEQTASASTGADEQTASASTGFEQAAVEMEAMGIPRSCAGTARAEIWVQKLHLDLRQRVEDALDSCTLKPPNDADHPLVLSVYFFPANLTMSIDVGINNLAIWIGQVHENGEMAETVAKTAAEEEEGSEEGSEAGDVTEEEACADAPVFVQAPLFTTIYWACHDVVQEMELDWDNVNTRSISECCDLLADFLHEQFPRKWYAQMRNILIEQQPTNMRMGNAAKNLKMRNCGETIRQVFRRLAPRARITWVSPQTKLKLLTLPPGVAEKKASKRYSIHKKAATAHVEEHLCSIPAVGKQKKDDFADALLQSLAWHKTQRDLRVEEQEKATKRVTRKRAAAAKRAGVVARAAARARKAKAKAETKAKKKVKPKKAKKRKAAASPSPKQSPRGRSI
jgi:hypothetical protein